MTYMTPDQILQDLMAGNQRYVDSQQTYPRQSAAHRESLVEAQTPPAAILGCADSRVAPELVFDQGIGDLFVARLAGNVVNADVLASFEFAVSALGVKLIMVMGHSLCGAVTAAVNPVGLTGHLISLAETIKPAVDAVRHVPGDLLQNSINQNARMMAQQLIDQSEVLAKAVKAGDLKIVAACYDLETGRVTLLDGD